MLDAAITDRIKEIIGDNNCRCGRPADRFRQIHSKGYTYFCHQCYSRMEVEEELEAKPHKRHTIVHSRIDDPDNMPDLFWSPPMGRRRKRREAVQQRRSA